MQIPFFLMERESQNLLDGGILSDIENVIKSGKYLFGPNMEKLEEYFSSYFNSYATLVGSGTDALFISLKALGIGPGDKVAIPSFTAIPTAIAVKLLGAEPIYVDINDSMTMDVKILEETLDLYNNIKAVIPVHLFGNTANITGIVSLCNHRYIPVVEDCAQSLGSCVNEKLTGTFGISGAFSFYPSKNLGTMGDGGMIITKDKSLADLFKELRFYGQSAKYKMGYHCGINSRMDEIQCAILLKKIESLNYIIESRKQMKIRYDNAFRSSSKLLWMPDWNEGAVPHLYPILSIHKEKIIKNLKDRGVETAIHYPFCLPEEIEKKPGLAYGTKAKKYSQIIFSIPFHPWLMKEEEDYILNAINETSI